MRGFILAMQCDAMLHRDDVMRCGVVKRFVSFLRGDAMPTMLRDVTCCHVQVYVWWQALVEND